MRPTLPTYSDQEILRFHPVFEYAMKAALKFKKLDYIEVKKPYPSPTGPIDLVLFNTKSQKVILPIEIKRTQSSVRGGGRRQARDYWQNLGSKCETLFYCVSNLELIELFRSENSRSKTSAQQIKLAHSISGNLATQTGDEVFYSNLIDNIKEMLDIVLGNKPHTYVVGLQELQDQLESAVNNPPLWHKILIPTCFEYIRGASTRIENLRKDRWQNATYFLKNPSRLIELGKKIDFEHIFKEPAPNLNDTNIFSNAVLTEAFNAGKALGEGDDIAELINEILEDYVPKKQGIIETDTELARLLSVIAKITLGRKLEENEFILDPASGSGRLLTVLHQVAFPEISPRQIKAIEKEPLFSEALSLRLGLAFGTSISPSNAPNVVIDGVENIKKSHFDDVKVVVMNPPYISGVQSKSMKEVFSKYIYGISGKKSELNLGQVGFEIIFLELISHLVSNGTVISVIFPSNHLYRTSKEMSAFRNYLLDHFGLNYIVTYPRDGLFSTVVKGTVILSGIKGKKADHVNLVEVWNTVSDIQLIDLYKVLSVVQDQHNTHINLRDVGLTRLSKIDLKNKVNSGWQEIIGSRAGEKFLEEYMFNFQYISSSNISRGGFGNKGNNGLTVISKTNKKYPTVFQKIPSDWIVPLLNNTYGMPRTLTSNSVPQVSFIPPSLAYIPKTKESRTLKLIINEYINTYIYTTGSQVKKAPDKENIIISLKSNGKTKYSNSILLPRASRVEGEVGIVEDEQILISTNVLLINMSNLYHSKLMGAWLLSVFGQLQLELYGVSQEGMRKLEVNIVKKVKYPDFSKIKKHKADRLIELFYTEKCINFCNIQQREVDSLWAEILWPNNKIILLNDAFNVFQELVDHRIGLG